MKISVVINTYNAQKYLDAVLNAVKDLDEIVICDMYSNDHTLQIAQKYNAKIVMHEKLSYADPARNFAIAQASNPWVLVIDADELVPNDLKKYLYEFTENQKYNGLRIPFKNYFMNRLMRSAYPDFHVRFFKKDKVFWPPTVHSKIQVEGDIYTIPRHKKNLAIQHIANDDVSLIIKKNHIYSTEEIKRKKDKKISIFTLIFSPWFWFVKYYWIKMGFLDGKKGFIFAKLKAQYKFNTLAKVYEFQQNQKHQYDSAWNAQYARAEDGDSSES